MYSDDSVLLEANREIEEIEAKLGTFKYSNKKDIEMIEKNLSYITRIIIELNRHPFDKEESSFNCKNFLIVSNLLNCLKVWIDFEIDILKNEF